MVDELEMLKQSLNVLRIMVASQQHQQQQQQLPPMAPVPSLPHFAPVPSLVTASPKKPLPSAAATTAEGVPRSKFDYFNNRA